MLSATSSLLIFASLVGVASAQDGSALTSTLANVSCAVVSTELRCRGHQLLMSVMPLIDKELGVPRNETVDAVEITVGSLHSLENGSLSSASLQTLRVLESNLTEVAPGAFVGVASLRCLDLSGNELASVPTAALQDLANLQSFKLARNRIVELASDSFDNVTSLVELDLRQNSISSVAVGTFYHLPSLLTLELSGNNLTTFDSSPFGNATLQNLTLASNRLEFVSLGASLGSIESLDLARNELRDQMVVLNLSKLVFLDLTNNSLKKLDFLQPLTSLVNLSVAHNLLSSLSPDWLSTLHKLKTLDVSYCKITYVAAGTFASLRDLITLNLAGNGISIVDSKAFVKLTSLKSLNLSNNKLTYVNWNHTQDLMALEFADLSHNNIEYIFTGAFESSPRLRSVLLTGSLLDCGCELLGFSRLLKGPTFTKEAVSSAMCDDGSTTVAEFDFDSLCKATEQTTVLTTPSSTSPSTTMPTAITTESSTATQTPPGQTLQPTSLTTTVLSTAVPPVTVVPFRGRITLVHTELVDDELSLTWNAFSANAPLDEFTCFLSVGVVESSYRTNLTGSCPPDSRNRTFVILNVQPAQRYEICLTIVKDRTRVAENCTNVNTTDLLRPTMKNPTTRKIETTATQSSEEPETTTTMLRFDATVSPVSNATKAATDTAATPDDDDFRYRLTFRTDLSEPDELVVTWWLSPATRKVPNCRFNVTVLENKDVLTRTEVFCSSGGQLSVGHVDPRNDYDVCFSAGSFDLPADCRQIPTTKLGSVHAAGSLSSSTSRGRSGAVGIPVALLVMIAAMVLIAVIAAVLLVYRKRQRRVVARRKVGESVFHLQMNRRSGSYQVQPAAAEGRPVTSCSTSQDGGKMSQRSSSVDEV
ncbi:leucine-rich repeats and immunoglobulin-like domains protein 1 [Ixodes scapularis]